MMFERLWNKFIDWFSLDLRSLALARIILGLTIAVDALWRMKYAEWFYSDIGVFPRWTLVGLNASPWQFSLHLANGTTGFAAILLAFHALFALSMAVGFRTRLSTIFVCLLTVSLHQRSPWLVNAGDAMARVLIITAMFIPWDRVWSVDQRRRSGTERDATASGQSISGSWIFCWFMITFCVYFFGYLFKTSSAWRSDYSALKLTLNFDDFAFSWSHLLLQYDGLLRFLTFFVLQLEKVGPILLVTGFLAPLRWAWKLKLLIVGLFVLFHLGILATLKVGVFPFVCLGCWAAFVPSQLWDRVFPKQGRWAQQEGVSTAQSSTLEVQVSSRWNIDRLRSLSVEALGLFMIFILLFGNISSLSSSHQIQFAFWRNAAKITQTYYQWSLFAPSPRTVNYWFEIPAHFADGTVRELISGESDIFSSKRQLFFEKITSKHWRKVFDGVRQKDSVAREYAMAWCRKLNRNTKLTSVNSPRLERLTIHLFSVRFDGDLKEEPPVKRVIFDGTCPSEKKQSQSPK